MPHAEESVPYQHIWVKELHPTFGAEVFGIDFSKPVPPEVFAEVKAAITKVLHLCPRPINHSPFPEHPD